MVAIVPTISNQRWGPKPWQLFDFYAHPSRDPGGNPCFVFMHGGGHIGGRAGDVWDDDQPGTSRWRKLFDYLHANERRMHFDIVSLESAQYRHTALIGSMPFASSEKVLFQDGVIDAKRGIAAVKAWGAGFGNTTIYRMNPAKFVQGGQSAGATKAAVAMLTPPLSAGATLQTWARRHFEHSSYDDQTLGCFFMMGQIAFGKKDWNGNGTPVYYLDPLFNIGYSGGRGTTFDGTGVAGLADWDAINDSLKESWSPLSYIQNGDLDYYKPMYLSYNRRNQPQPATLPLADFHDERQMNDLASALEAAFLRDGRKPAYVKDLIPVIDGAIPADSAYRIYSWMENLVADAKSTISRRLPAPIT